MKFPPTNVVTYIYACMFVVEKPLQYKRILQEIKIT